MHMPNTNYYFQSGRGRDGLEKLNHALTFITLMNN